MAEKRANVQVLCLVATVVLVAALQVIGKMEENNNGGGLLLHASNG